LQLAVTGNTQPIGDTTVPDKTKVWVVASAQSALWAGSFVALNKAWYADYPKQSFHFFNDRFNSFSQVSLNKIKF
jgi:hypothetical protein